jgi:hypothetical protein
VSGRWPLLYVSPHAALRAELPTRPARLLEALRASGAIGPVTVVNRRQPADIGRFLRRRSLAIETALGLDLSVLEHPRPFGPIESRWLANLVRQSIAGGSERLVVWVSDPKSAGVLARLGTLGNRVIRLFDAYDAWDLSPLVRGGWRRRAVARGYETAAASADLVLANSPFMARRMSNLGARRPIREPDAQAGIRISALCRPNP